MAERRRQELEDKRAKLAEMKRAREQRQAMLKMAEGPGSGATTPGDMAAMSNRKDVDDLVSALLGPTAGSSALPSRSTTPSAGPLHSHPAVPRLPSGGTVGGSRPATPISAVGSGRGSRMSERDHVDDQVAALTSAPQPDLVDGELELFEIPTKHATITYSRGVQTASSHARSASLDEDDQREDQIGRETEDDLRRRLEAEFEVEKQRLEREIRREEEERQKLEQRVIDLSDDERQKIYSTADFSQFVEDSSKIIQRALSDAYDYTTDYRIGLDAVLSNDANETKLVCAFKDDRWTKNRSVTSLDWSPKFPELVAAGYNKNPKAFNDPDGIVAVWNLHLLERPEFVFHAQSDVLSVAFSPFHPNLIFGGTYSGQILLWDTRAKHLPVLKSPLSASGHTYPIYSIKVIGTQNAHNLITSSTDGLVCSWVTDMLAQPQETLELVNPGHAKTNEVSITCFDFPDDEASTFWIGTEEGGIHQAHRYDRAGSKAGLNLKDSYQSHAGPVTSLDFHPLRGPVDFSDLFLTTSVDWTVKLWRARSTGKSTTALASTASGITRTISPLMTFENPMIMCMTQSGIRLILPCLGR